MGSISQNSFEYCLVSENALIWVVEVYILLKYWPTSFRANVKATISKGILSQVAIHFSDIQGFTSSTEQLTPSELVVLIDEYLEEMSFIIIETGGTIYKFMWGNSQVGQYLSKIYTSTTQINAFLETRQYSKEFWEILPPVKT